MASEMRDKIISEIKRLSAKHGKVIGLGQFETVTAIGRGAWQGKYWARWSDALIEAGFEPNTVTAKTNSDLYFTKLADAFRYFNRIPTTKELPLYRNNVDKELPSSATFQNTFGSKDEMLRQLKAWVSEKPEYADVAAMLEAIDDEPKAQAVSGTPAKDGWVYVIQYGDSYKIGAGGDLEKRVKQVTTKLPENGELIHAIRTDDPFGIENYWHRRFADKRAKNNSEFFKLSVQDIRVMKKRKFM